MSDYSSLDYLFDLDSLLEDTANECELIDRNNARKEIVFYKTCSGTKEG